MKKITLIAVLGMLFLSFALPILRADGDETSEAAGTGMSGTPQEFADLQKTLGSEKIDNLEQSVADLKQTVTALNERVEDLERTVFDDNSRV